MRTCGTVSCYQNGCRCDDCRRAAREARRRYRHPKAIDQRWMCPMCGRWFVRPGGHSVRCRGES